MDQKNIQVFFGTRFQKMQRKTWCVCEKEKRGKPTDHILICICHYGDQLHCTRIR